jgi:alkanesulfonate monooxygenase SsuD/methylene tetrahydromethanopterin reductase-like flavin-dependent oxidoreductase (luciferase family)
MRLDGPKGQICYIQKILSHDALYVHEMSGKQVAPEDVTFGVGLYPWGKEEPTFEEMVDVAEHADDLDFHSVQVPLHTIFPAETWIFPDFGNEFMFDMDTLVTGLAARTSNIKIAANATVPNLYNPYMIARKYATMDHISDGRLILGIAPGWIEEEYEIVDGDYENRGEKCVEHTQEMIKFWTEDDADYDFEGTHIEDLGLQPKPQQDPHIPLWYAGSSRAAVRRAGEFAQNLCLYCKDLKSRSLIGDHIAPDLEEEAGDRDVDISLYTFAAVTQDEEEAEMMDDILMRSYDGWAGEGNEYELSLVGDAEEVREGVRKLAAEGVSHVNLDLNTHGLETNDTLKRRLTDFKEQVVDEL